MEPNSSTGQLTLDQMKSELARKRKSLDKEIEKFMAQKEAEYRKFQQDLKAQLEQIAIEKPAQKSIRDSPTIVARGFIVRSPSKDATGSQENLPSPQVSGRNNGSTAEDSTKQSTNSLNVLARSSNRANQNIEASAILQPAYLPLLEPKAFQRISSHEVSLEDSKISTSRLSCSLDEQSHGSGSERPGPLDRRSSSSPTGTGKTSRRKSSLKQPTNGDTTRERKHVLFSIDNKVISPSSSPVTKRTGIVHDPPVQQTAGLGDLLAVEASQMNTATMPVLSPQDMPPLALSQPRSYQQLVEPIITTPPADLVKEELLLSSKDPLFEADDLPPSLIEYEESESSPIDFTVEDEVDFVPASPHVGSVPIHIQSISRR